MMKIRSLLTAVVALACMSGVAFARGEVVRVDGHMYVVPSTADVARMHRGCNSLQDEAKSKDCNGLVDSLNSGYDEAVGFATHAKLAKEVGDSREDNFRADAYRTILDTHLVLIFTQHHYPETKEGYPLPK